MRGKFKFAVILAAALGIGSGAAVSGELDTDDPLSKWNKIKAEELGGLAGLGVNVEGENNVGNEDSFNFTQKNYADSDQDNDHSPLIVEGDHGGSAELTTGTIFGDYFLYNHGMFVITKISGNLNNVNQNVQFNIYFKQ